MGAVLEGYSTHPKNVLDLYVETCTERFRILFRSMYKAKKFMKMSSQIQACGVCASPDCFGEACLTTH